MESLKEFKQESVQHKQAEFMAKLSGFELDYQEKIDYEFARSEIDGIFGRMSDQTLLYICVSPEHKEKLLERFPNIDMDVI